MILSSFDVLPDGTLFSFWDCTTTFTKTLHVAQNHPQARDDGPGTEAEPFKTISRAAEIVQPGERVLISAGTYRECVRIPRGGTGPDKMISYEAQPGDTVILTGAEQWKGPFLESEGWPLWGRKDVPEGVPPNKTRTARIWMAKLPRNSFEGYNPFGMSNVPNSPWGPNHFYEGYQGFSSKVEYLMRRGIVFVDGQPLRQAQFPCVGELPPGTFWIEDSGLVIHFRLLNDDEPKNHAFEFTAREQCFTAEDRYQGFVRIKGLTVEKVGNGFPPPQRGAISTNSGNHWIIEDCTVRWANTLGMDIGKQAPAQVTHHRQGRHIVRRNLVTDCGICGIAGVQLGFTAESDVDDLTKYDHQATGVLVEHNRLERNGWRDMEGLCESAAIKIHALHNSLVRHNIILDTLHGCGIWADWQIVNSRICSNAILGIRFTHFGGIFVEAAKHRNSVDNNVISNVGTCPSVGGDPTCGGNGIYQHDCDKQVVRHNFIHQAQKAGVMINLGEKNRIVYGRGATGRKNHVESNLFADCGWAITFPTPDNFANGNLFGAFTQEGVLRIQQPEERLSLAAWREFHGWDIDGKKVKVTAAVDVEKLRLTFTIDDAGKVTEKSVDLRQDFVVEGLW